MWTCPNPCPLWCDKGNNTVFSCGNKKSHLAIVGEGPGTSEVMVTRRRREDRQMGLLKGNPSRPFAGESGALLRWGLGEVGLLPKECSYSQLYKDYFITNATRCYPSKFSVKSDTDDTYTTEVGTECLKKCRGYLKRDLFECSPKYVLALGAKAFQSVMREWDKGILDVRGFYWPNKEFNCIVVPTIHPALILRDWQPTSSFVRDLQRLKDLMDKGLPANDLDGNVTYSTVRTISDFNRMMEKLNSAEWLAWDTETSSLKFWQKGEVILGFSFCGKVGTAYYVPIYNTDNDKGRQDTVWKSKDKTYVLTQIKRLLEKKGIKRTTANGKFDINWCKGLDIEVESNDHDVLQVHHLIDENTPQDLNYMLVYYDIPFHKYDDAIHPFIKKVDGERRYEYIPTAVLSSYACADADATLRVTKKQLSVMNEDQHSIYNTISVEISKFASDMEVHGSLIDVDQIEVLEKKYEKTIEKKVNSLALKVGIPGFNVQSSKMVGKLIYEKWKLPVGKKSKKGKPSTDKKTLEFLARRHPKVKTILGFVDELRKMRKMASTYLTGYKKLVDSNNRLHTSYMTTGTVTGRLSSRNPNLQNCPRDPIFRSLFIAGPGRKLIVADYSQIEARLMAFLAGETLLIKKFSDPNFDIHTFTSVSVRKLKNPKITEKDITKEQRSHDKAITFGINYGRAAYSISQEYNLELEEVEDYIDAYFTTYPNIRRYREKCVAVARKTFELKNAVGRIRHFDGYKWLYSPQWQQMVKYTEEEVQKRRRYSGIEGGLDRQAINSRIQSYASDILSRAIGKVRKEIRRQDLDAFMMLDVHDCQIANSSEEHAEKVKQIIVEKMPVTLERKSYKMTFGADVSIEDHWKQ